MTRSIRPSSKWLALSAGALLAPAAQAAPFNTHQVCYSDSVPMQTTNWVSSVSIPRFNPADGILIGIHFWLHGSAVGDARVESLDNAPSTTSLQFASTIVLTRPDNSLVTFAIPQQNFSDDLTAFDGVIDFAGSSGTSHDDIIAVQSASAASPLPASDLSLFSGAGNIVLPVSASGASTGSGAGNMLVKFHQKAAASVEVCYIFYLDCNQNGIPDFIDVQQGYADENADGIPDECQPSTLEFCFGDGSDNGGVDCPCMNNVPDGVHEGCLNGRGVGAKLTASGIPSVSNDTLALTASQLPGNTQGWFFQGMGVSNAGDGAPFANGLRCIDNTIVVQKIRSNGGVFPSPNAPPISEQCGINAGETRYYQVFYRNYIGPCDQHVNSTNAVKVVWGM